MSDHIQWEILLTFDYISWLSAAIPLLQTTNNDYIFSQKQKTTITPSRTAEENFFPCIISEPGIVIALLSSIISNIT